MSEPRVVLDDEDEGDGNHEKEGAEYLRLKRIKSPLRTRIRPSPLIRYKLSSSQVVWY